MPKIIIDDIEYEVEAGNNLLEACLGLKLDLPYFCWHPAMGSIGACRQCAVVQYLNDEDTRGRIVMGCMTPVSEGARFSLGGEKASEFRATVIEALMLNHPHDCPVCAEGGECHLQDMTVMSGHRDRTYRGKKNTHRNQYLGPLIHHEMNRCISCYRCTRFYRDYAGGDDLAAMAAHDHVYFGRHEAGVLESEFSGNLVEVCPTGVFTDETLVKDYTRKWDLQSAPSVCTGCAVGCNTMPGERYGRLKRIHNRFNVEVNGYFLCDRGRFGGAFVNSEKRLKFSGLRDTDGRFNAINRDVALETSVAWLAQSRVAGIGSPRASVEANYLLRKLVGEDNFSNGMNDDEAMLVAEISQLMLSGRSPPPSLKKMETADAVLILGEDVTNTAPRLALSLRQAVTHNMAAELGETLGLQDWQDAAIRNLAQNQRKPLYAIAVKDTRLDDIAISTSAMAPDDIARLGFAVAHFIDDSLPPVDKLSDRYSNLAQQIAKDLQQAAAPLVVSGTGSQHVGICQAAALITRALQQTNTGVMLSFCVPECNSLGQALLTGGEGQDLAELTVRAIAGEIDTLIVLENDLFRRAGSGQITQLLASVSKLIVLDCVDTETTSMASLVIPVSSFAETESTYVSSEGRAQRSYPVFEPADDVLADWQWLLALSRKLGKAELALIEHFDDIVDACASEVGALSGIKDAAPGADYRLRGMKIPRQTHRYSGRTAMHAGVQIHEPKQTQDIETPLAYSMEGLNGNEVGALLPYVWAPGWNSNQSLHKFQHGVGGALKGGTAGSRLIIGDGNTLTAESIPGPFHASVGEFLLVPLQRIFGSDELSMLAPAIAELADSPAVFLHPDDAIVMGVHQGDGVVIMVDGKEYHFELGIDDSLAQGCAGFVCGFQDTNNLRPGDSVCLAKAQNWQHKKPQVISTDGGSRHV
ncbi:MAG: NADH-quinone oxidoreductase subunit NuoG [Pseudomonadales bacterium]